MLDRHADVLVVLLLPPSPDVQAERLRDRGDDEDEVARRLAKGRLEEQEGRALTSHVVVNDDLDRAVAEVVGILDAHRSSTRPPGADSPRGSH